MEEFVMYHIVSIIQMLVFTIYLKEMLGLKRSVWWMVMCWSGFVVINYCVTNVTNSVGVNGIMVVVCFAFMTVWMSNGSLKRKIFFSLGYYGISALIEIILVSGVIFLSNSSMDVIADNNTISTCLMILTQMFVFIVIQISRLCWRNYLDNEASIKDWIATFSISAGCVLALLILTVHMVENDDFSILLIIVLFILLCINFFSYYFYSVSAEKNRIEMEAKLYQKQIGMYQEWYEGIQYARNEIRSFRHDMNNHFSVLKSFCHKGIKNSKEREHLIEIEKYIDGIGIKSYKMVFNTDSGNLVLDSMIDLKKSYALSKGIIITEKLYIPRNMKYENADMIILLGNLLDNAIEACENGEIILKIECEKTNLIIMIQNSYNGKIDGQSGEITDSQTWKTTKKDVGEHGIGMKNITTIVKKYDGIAQWKAEKGIFRIDILLYQFIL